MHVDSITGQILLGGIKYSKLQANKNITYLSFWQSENRGAT